MLQYYMTSLISTASRWMENKKKKRARKNEERVPVSNERSYTRKNDHKRNSDEMDDYDNFRIETFHNTNDDDDYDGRDMSQSQDVAHDQYPYQQYQHTENDHHGNSRRMNDYQEQEQNQDQEQEQEQDQDQEQNQNQNQNQQQEYKNHNHNHNQESRYGSSNREKDQKPLRDRYIRPTPITSSSLSNSTFSTSFNKYDNPKHTVTDEKTKLFEKISYMTHLLESQQHEKTSNVMEEFVLYLLLGTFMIFTIDTFVRYRIIR